MVGSRRVGWGDGLSARLGRGGVADAGRTLVRCADDRAARTRARPLPGAVCGARFLDAYSQLLIVAGATTLLSVTIGAACAYALARLDFRGKTPALAFVLAVSMFPQISIVSPLFLLLRELHLLNTYRGLVLPYLTFSMPLAIWLLTGFFRQLPLDLEEAALVDGASRIRAMVEIVLPLAAPALATTAILTFLYSWNEFLFALSFTLGPERYTVPVAIALFRGQYQYRGERFWRERSSRPFRLRSWCWLHNAASSPVLTSGAVKG